ncbi:hypothetical protein [Exiguobacterium sp. s146]|uniref:hypothetical protein n=1 Tax=Exiguobacterium sp. s146 TaxID=2751223 RepID=UPI001BE964AD|nr:hypothetical protein [Exiguobacterium sp. s146]
MNVHMPIPLMPTEEVVQVWMASMVPPMDLFMADAGLVARLGTDANVLIVPRSEFDVHPSYRDIRMANAYTYWTIDREAAFVLHASPGWVATLLPDVRRELLAYQVTIGRGLVFPATDLEMDSLSTSIVTVDDGSYFILHQSAFQAMSDEMRRRLTFEYAKAWDEWTACLVPDTCPTHVQRLANTFPVTSGGNCLAATLFAVTGADWMATQWVHSGTFLQTLGQAGYVRIESETTERGDVLTFVDEAGRVQHATYCIGAGLFFNKNGQTLFNPWKLIQEHELFEAWGDYTCHIYRRP